MQLVVEMYTAFGIKILLKENFYWTKEAKESCARECLLRFDNNGNII